MIIAIVVSDFNKAITKRMLASARKTLAAHAEVQTGAIVHVPGCFEIPMAAKMLAAMKTPPDAIICLGAVIKGKTDQNNYILQACALGLEQTQLASNVPMTFGIISAPSEKLARQRSSGKLDRGREAAEAALAMAQLKKNAPLLLKQLPTLS